MIRILIAAAAIPALLLLFLVYRMDRLEKEPIRLLIKLALFGFIAAACAVVTERIGTAIMDSVWSSYTFSYAFVMYYFVVALSEEGFKYLFLRIASWRAPSFDCQFDGVVYAVFASLGFALIENILYVIQFGFGTALLRAVTAVPGHACFGVFMGVWYGLARRYALAGQKSASSACHAMAIIVPVLLHGTYDFIATVDATAYSLIFIGFVLILFTVSFIVVRKAAKRVRYIDNTPTIII